MSAFPSASDIGRGGGWRRLGAISGLMRCSKSYPIQPHQSLSRAASAE